MQIVGGAMRRAALVVVIAALAGPAAADDLTLADLKWPTTTRSAITRWRAHVVDAAGGRRVGVLVRGARVAWKRIVGARDHCGAWLELEPRGYACAHDLKPSDEDVVPTIVDQAPIERWADVKKDGADAYDSPDDITAGAVARVVPDKTFVAVKANARSVKVGGVRYVKTDQGWIASDRLSWYEPSEFAGLELATTAPPSWPFAWIVPHRHGAKVIVRDDNGAELRELAARDVVAVISVRGPQVQIATGEWIDRDDVRIADKTSRPDGVGDHDKWLDVSLDEQVLIAYEGDTPVFATLVSTGRKRWETPTGIYRVAGKYARVRMQDPGGMADEWNVADVPWTMRFRKNFALHGTYWHDGFGRARSHGCVNLSPSDAHRLYAWTTPDVPDGWSEAEASADDATGTPVRIRSARDPDPIWRRFDGKPLAPIDP